MVITVLVVGGTGGIDGDGDYGVGDDGGGDGSCNGDDSNNVGMVVISTASCSPSQPTIENWRLHICFFKFHRSRK